MEDIIRDNKPTIIILAGALLIIIIVLLLFIPLREEKIKSNKKYFPNYEDIVINEKVISQGKVLNEREIANFIRILA